MSTKVLRSTVLVVEHAQHVCINHEKAKQYAYGLQNKDFSYRRLSHAPYDITTLSDKEKAIFLLLLNAISFSYRDGYAQKRKVTYGSTLLDGAWAMIASLGKAIQAGYPLLQFTYLEQLSLSDLHAILSGYGEIPLLQVRHHILQELGHGMNTYFQGDFDRFFQSAQHDASLLIDTLLLHFPSFLDVSIYAGKQIFFLKRAQLFVADLYQCFGGMGYGSIDNVNMLTACADYKLPRILRKQGILEYSSSLQEKIDAGVQLPMGSVEEVEIRAHTIRAVEYIKKYLQGYGASVESFQINDYLRLESQSKKVHDAPYHLTRTCAY